MRNYSFLRTLDDYDAPFKKMGTINLSYSDPDVSLVDFITRSLDFDEPPLPLPLK